MQNQGVQALPLLWLWPGRVGNPKQEAFRSVEAWRNGYIPCVLDNVVIYQPKCKETDPIGYPSSLAAQSLCTALISSHFDSLLPVLVPHLLGKESCRYGINLEASSVNFQGAQTQSCQGCVFWRCNLPLVFSILKFLRYICE